LVLGNGYLEPGVWELWRRELEWTTAWPELKHQFASYPEFVAYVEGLQQEVGPVHGA
jgi:hypothetical protein